MTSDLAQPQSELIPALALRGIDKRFGSVHANRTVSLTVAKGSIHGLIGENGAGKSTLANIVHGFHQPDEGVIEVAGRPVRFRSPQDSISVGIGMVHQHFMLVETFTVLENVILGYEGGQNLRRGLDQARRELERLAAQHGLAVPLTARVGDLPVGLRQRVEILKALYRRAELLILDEPTAVLTPQEADHLFAILRQLRAEGKTILLVTHKLREVMAVTDRVTVMRQGAVVAEFATPETTPRQLAETMIGRSVQLRVEKTPAPPGEILLSARELIAKDDLGAVKVNRVSLDLRRREIVGLAGISDNGQSELLEALAGMRKLEAGQVRLKGQDLALADPRERRQRGLVHVPEDRLRHGIVPTLSAEDNSILGYQRTVRFQRAGLLRRDAIRADCERRLEEFDVRPRNPELRMGALSGGNQQKLVLAREIAQEPDVLLIGQPTRGVDIGAIEFIHRRLIALRDAGKAILLVSVELEEILALADRILVMHGGVIAGELLPKEATEERLGLLMAGVKDQAS